MIINFEIILVSSCMYMVYILRKINLRAVRCELEMYIDNSCSTIKGSRVKNTLCICL